MHPSRHSAQVQHAPQRWTAQQQQQQQSAAGPLGSPTAPLPLSMQSSPLPGSKEAHSPRKQLPFFLTHSARRTQQQQQQPQQQQQATAHVPQYLSVSQIQQQQQQLPPHLFLSPIVSHKQTAHMTQTQTPLTAFTPSVAATPTAAAGLHASGSHLHSSSLFSASSTGSQGSADHSFVDDGSASFASPLHPHHLSFDAAASPVSLSASPIDLNLSGVAEEGEADNNNNKALASPVSILAPFAFVAQVSPQRSDAEDSTSFPVLQPARPAHRATAQTQQQQQQHQKAALPCLPSTHVTPASDSSPHSPVYRSSTSGSSASSSASTAMLDSPEAPQARTASAAAAASSACPFVSPMVVRSVGLHGTPLHPSAMGSNGNGGAVVHPRTLPRSIHLPAPAASSSSLQISTLHRGGVASGGPASAGTGGSGRSGHHRSSSSTDMQPLLMRRRGGPLLNSKRHRGSSMDLQAERDSGAVLPMFGVFGTGYGSSAFSSVQQRCAQAAAAASSSSTATEAFDPLCPASAITHSMRKLRVKKSALPSPARVSRSGDPASISEHDDAEPAADADDEMETEADAITPPTQHQRRSSGFSSSDEEGPSTVSATAATPASLNLKQQRRARALQSIHKKRAAILAEHSTPAPGALTMGLHEQDQERERGQAQLVQALAAAAASSAAFQQHHLVLPQAPGFVVHSPLRRRRDAEAEAELAATPVQGAFNLQISIPDARAPMQQQQQQQQSQHSSALMSPPAASAAAGRCLSWDDDDDDESGVSGAPSLLSSAASTALRMPMPSHFNSSSFALSGSAARLRAAQEELQVPEEDVGGVATVLRFGDDSDDDGEQQQHSMQGASAHGHGHEAAVEEEEGADLIGEDMGLIVPAANEARSSAAFLSHRRRRSSMGSALVAPDGFMLGLGAQSMQMRGCSPAGGAAEATTPTHGPSAPVRWGSGSGSGYGSGSGNRYSPLPHHTPLTPTASNLPLSPPFSGSNWGSFPALGGAATPLPLLPAMRMPESRLPEDLAAAAAAAKQSQAAAGAGAGAASGLSLSIEEGDAGLTEMDFRSPVNTGSHHLVFPSGVMMQHPLGLAPVPGMGEESAGNANGGATAPESFTITLDRHGSLVRPARERRASTPSSDLSTPPLSPRLLGGGGGGSISLAQSLASMSPDPKAFLESRSLQPRRAVVPLNLTPMRSGMGLANGTGSGLCTRGSGPGLGLGLGLHPGAGMLGAELGLGLHGHGQVHKQLQPPPTPVRPSSIKRLRASASTAASAVGAATPAKKASSLAHALSSASSLTGCSSPPPASSAHLFGFGAAGLTADSSDSAASATAAFNGATAPGAARGSHGAPLAPAFLPSCHSRTRLERTSSLYDSKVLIDFKAALAAAAAAKQQRLAMAQSHNQESVEEDADHSMGDGSGAGSSPAHGPAHSASAVAATPGPRSLAPPPTPASAQQQHNQSLVFSSPMPPQQNLQGSIWDSGFTNKVLVGTGSFFETFRCQSCDKSDPVRSDEYGQFFAVKRSLKPFRGKRDRGLYLREVALMESLGTHENIVRHIRAWQEDMHFFIQMEYCPMNLTEYVASLHATQQAEALSRGDLSPSAVASGSVSLTGLSDSLLKNITLQLASALHHIHQRGLVHLDVKPDNALVSFGGIVKLADFGQARLLKPLDGAAAAAAVGSGAAVSSAAAAALALCPDFDMDGVEGDCQYMSPELLGGPGPSHSPRSGGRSGEPVPTGPSAACDIFSLGLTLVELASGAVLPKSGPLWHELRTGHAARHIHGRVSAVMEHIILNLLEPHPKDRPTAKQIVQWIHAHST